MGELPSDRPTSPTVTQLATRDSAVRTAGKLLLLSAAGSAVMVAARVGADADQATLTESLRAIADSRPVYTVNGVARLIAGSASVAGGLYLLKAWAVSGRPVTSVFSYLLTASGAITVLSGVCTIILAAYAPEITAFVENVSDARWVTGKIGFTIAGLALLLTAKYQWQVGGILRKVSPASAIVGIAMQFTWVDAATIMHPIIGAAFLLWLIAVGAMLATGRTEKLFVAAYSQPTEAAG